MNILNISVWICMQFTEFRKQLEKIPKIHKNLEI